jgi:hypothetical protein
VSTIHSAGSFYESRVDTEIDNRLTDLQADLALGSASREVICVAVLLRIVAWAREVHWRSPAMVSAASG